MSWETKLSVRLTPRASSNGILRYEDGILYLRLTAPPVEGAANVACCDYIAELLGLRSAQVSVCHGHKSRDKVLGIVGINEGTLRETLQCAALKS